MKPLRAFQENPVLTDSAEFISSSSDETSKRHKVFNTFWPAAASALAVSQGSTSLEGPDTQHEKSISMVKTVRTFLAQPVLTSSLQSRPASDSVGRKSKPYEPSLTLRFQHPALKRKCKNLRTRKARQLMVKFKSWSSGYEWRLMFKRSWVWISALYSGGTFSH